MTNLTFLVHISSRDSLELHPSNTGGDFYAHLPYVVHLPGTWVCAVEAVYATHIKTDYSVICLHAELNFVRPSIAYGRQAKIAATFEYEEERTKHREVKEHIPLNTKGVLVDAQEISWIRFRLLTHKLEPCSFIGNEAVVLLRFTRIEKPK